MGMSGWCSRIETASTRANERWFFDVIMHAAISLRPSSAAATGDATEIGIETVTEIGIDNATLAFTVTMVGTAAMVATADTEGMADTADTVAMEITATATMPTLGEAPWVAPPAPVSRRSLARVIS